MNEKIEDFKFSNWEDSAKTLETENKKLKKRVKELEAELKDRTKIIEITEKLRQQWEEYQALETEVEKYKKVWMMAASLYDENGLAMPKDLMFKNFKDLDKEVLKWKVGYEKTKPRRGEMDG